MLKLKIITKKIQKEKRRARNKNLAIAVTLGAVAGAVVALVIASKADVIEEAVAEKKEKFFEVVDSGAKKAGEIVQEGKEKIETILIRRLPHYKKLQPM